MISPLALSEIEILRSILNMDNTGSIITLLRGWSNVLAENNTVDAGKRQGFSMIIEKYLFIGGGEAWVGGGGGVGEGKH